MSIERAAFFLDTARGRRFCLDTAPLRPAVGAMLYFPPFAEEMNRSRRMAALAARAFAARGWRVLQPDPGGCGDSAGDFGDADWRGWIDDMADAWHWLAARTGGRRVAWALRAGSLLLADWLRGVDCQPELLLWQPVFDGERHVRQFLRLEAARRMLAGNDARAATAALRAALDEGEAVEVAGYTLNPALTRGLGDARLALPAGYHGAVHLIETGREEGQPSPAAAAFAAASGSGAQAHRVAGAAFWQTPEITEAPALIEKSLAALDRAQA
jgi:exosortase A-associated hydrolase 2